MLIQVIGAVMVQAWAARIAIACLWLASGACGKTPMTTPTGPSPAAPGPAVLVGAGDIAECGLAGAEETARLLDQIDGTVFVAGDNAYYTGSRLEYEQCYGPTWGRHKSRTRPIPGNHDYETPGAEGYFAYFGTGATSPPGYYSYEVGGWHVVALNSNVPIEGGSAQFEWLHADLASHRTPCALAIVHHPLFSSSVNGPTARLRPVWDLLYAEGVEVVVSGHDHLYERFAPLDPSGRSDPSSGIRQFVAGTGGAHLYPMGAPQPGSEALASLWGVLKFTLRAADYQWEFVPVAGQAFRDAGAGVCH